MSDDELGRGPVPDEAGLEQEPTIISGPDGPYDIRDSAGGVGDVLDQLAALSAELPDDALIGSMNADLGTAARIREEFSRYVGLEVAQQDPIAPELDRLMEERIDIMPATQRLVAIVAEYLSGDSELREAIESTDSFADLEDSDLGDVTFGPFAGVRLVRHIKSELQRMPDSQRIQIAMESAENLNAMLDTYEQSGAAMHTEIERIDNFLMWLFEQGITLDPAVIKRIPSLSQRVDDLERQAFVESRTSRGKNEDGEQAQERPDQHDFTQLAKQVVGLSMRGLPDNEDITRLRELVGVVGLNIRMAAEMQIDGGKNVVSQARRMRTLGANVVRMLRGDRRELLLEAHSELAHSNIADIVSLSGSQSEFMRDLARRGQQAARGLDQSGIDQLAARREILGDVIEQLKDMSRAFIYDSLNSALNTAHVLKDERGHSFTAKQQGRIRRGINTTAQVLHVDDQQELSARMTSILDEAA